MKTFIKPKDLDKPSSWTSIQMDWNEKFSSSQFHVKTIGTNETLSEHACDYGETRLRTHPRHTLNTLEHA